MTTPTYAVSGASGHVGRLAIHELLARGIAAADVVAIVRARTKAADVAGRGVHVREADYSLPRTLGAALAGVDRLLLVSSSEPGQRVAHHTNVIEAAGTAGTFRIVYTSMLNADDTTSPLAGEHQDSEQALCGAGVAFTLLRNGWYTENYTDQLDTYLQATEILGAAGSGRISAATRQDYAAAATTALLQDQKGNRTYELGGPAFDLPELAQVISEVTGTLVTYCDLPLEEYATRLRETGLDQASAHFVAALDASIAHGDLETGSGDLAQLLGHPPTPLVTSSLRPTTNQEGALMASTTQLTNRTADLLALMKKGDDAFNCQDFASMDAVHHPDMIVHMPGTGRPILGREAHAAAMEQMFHVFPDVHVDNDPYPVQFGSGDWITVITRCTGTFSGEMTLPDGNVIAPTGETFDLDFATTAKWEGNLLIEEHVFWDSALQAQQVGLFRGTKTA